jgi:hypothetical protein
MIDDEHTNDGRGPDGRFPKGVSGNPGGIPKSARRLKKMARAEAAAMLEDLRTMRMSGELEPKEAIAYAKLMLEYGGYLTGSDEARLIVSAALAREKFKGNEEEFLRFVAVTLGKPVDLVRGPSDQKQITAGVAQQQSTASSETLTDVADMQGEGPASGSIDESE